MPASRRRRPAAAAAAPRARTPPAPRPPGPLAAYHRATRDPATIALLTVPLALVYGLGLTIASPHTRSGVDLVSQHLLGALSATGFIAVQLGVAAVVVAVAAFRLRATLGRRALLAFPVVAESVGYAALLVLGAVAFAEHAARLGPLLLPAALVDRAVLSAGAGLWEELVFRLLLVPALAYGIVRAWRAHRAVAIAAAVTVSSLAFAAAHHLAGEPFVLWIFAYRTLAGAAFAALFLTRGFAVAAWSHAVYDFYVLSAAA